MSSFRMTDNFLVSLLAAVASVVLVLAEDHVHVTLTDTSTWASPFEHKCGLVMVASLTWLVVECFRSAFLAERQSYRSGNFSARRRKSLSARILR